MAERAIAVVQNGGLAAPEMWQWNREQLDLMKATVAVGLTDNEFDLFVHVARHRRLDPFAKQIYAIRRGGKLTFQTSIDGFRLIAQRSMEYAGQDGPYWCGVDGVWREVWFDKTPPAAAKVGVLRTGFRDYVYAVARWTNYASVNTQNVWATMPDLMLAKVAEALALRRAFPEELSGLYTSDEMDQADAVDAPESRESTGYPQNTQSPAQPRNAPRAQQNTSQQGFNRESMRGQPQTEPQRRRLHAIANEAGWTSDQIHGRAGEINADARETLDALDKAQISELMDAIANEQPWVDPRQQRMDMSAPQDIEAAYRDVPDDDEDDWVAPQVTGVFADDVRIMTDCARATESSEELAHLWRFARSLQLSTDPELKGLFALRRRELLPDSPGNGNTGGK